MSNSSGWENVDATTEPGRYAHKLDAINQLAFVQENQRLGYTMLKAAPGSHILDVGCGTGDDIRQLVEIVGLTGRVIGVDYSATLLREAMLRLNTMPGVRLVVGDAHRLPFSDEIFDGCWASRVIHHLQDPKQVLSEMIRVTRPAGRIVIAEADWETLTVDAPRRITRIITNYHCDHLKHGWIGRQLPGLFRQAELVDIAISPVTLIVTDLDLAEHAFGLKSVAQHAEQAGYLSSQECRDWLAYLQEAHRQGTLFSTVTGFIVAGQKRD